MTFFLPAVLAWGTMNCRGTLRDRTLRPIMVHASIYGYHTAETGQQLATAADTFGWTAAAFIDLAIQASQEGGSR
jgi:hypothetical protein